MSVNPAAPRGAVADYDSNDYDYQTFWAGRDYEQWAETQVLARLMRVLGPSEWFADFGGGYGRNAEHYRDWAAHAVLVDYSVTNLNHAGDLHAADVSAGRLHLVRADLAALPFVDRAFDGAMTVRVLHHLADVEAAVDETLRTIRARALFDVPIKHHVLARARALRSKAKRRQVADADPVQVGRTAEKFWTFQLDAVRSLIDRAGFDTTVAASVNNFRRWDQHIPDPAVRLLSVPMRGLERAAQRAGRGWWGPNQFVIASRRSPEAANLAAAPATVGPQLAALARRMRCPSCAGALTWTPQRATCPTCSAEFERRGAFWDFVR
jgi:ubiquinone/menaquinone biosynthesis C-methylase UbiE